MFEKLAHALDVIDKYLPDPPQWSEARAEDFKRAWLGEDE